MANYNLTNQPISSSFGQLLQKDVTTSTLYDGTGSVVSDLDITSSYALTASYAENVVDPTWDNIQNKPSGIVSGSSQIILEDTTGNLSGSRIEGAVALATNSVSASIANSATTALLATSSSHAEVADEVPYSGVTGKPTLVSGSSQIDLSLATGTAANATNAVNADNIALTADNVNTNRYVPFTATANGDGTLLTDAGLLYNAFSNTLTATTFNGDLSGNASTATTADTATSASHALFSEEAENALHADSVQFPVIAKETLSKGDPVYVSGYNDGEGKPQVLKADASDSSKMPVVGLAMVDAVNNDQIFVISAGSFPNVDTSNGLTAPQVGQTLYVASGGGYTNVKPTGTNLIQNIGIIGRVQQNNGEIVVSAIQRTNDVPNIQQGYTWVGDSNGVAQAVSTASWDAHADLTSLNSFTASQETINGFYNSFTASNGNDSLNTFSSSIQSEVDNLISVTGSYATTGSNVFRGNQQFNTGSLEFVNMSEQVGINLNNTSIVDGNQIFANEITANGKFVGFAPSFDAGEIIDLNYPFTGSFGANGRLTQRFTREGTGPYVTSFEQAVSGVDFSYFKQEDGASMNFETLSSCKISFFPGGNFESTKILDQTVDALTSNGQLDSITISPYTGSNGTIYTHNYFGIQNYPSSNYDNSFVMGKYNSSFTRVNEILVGEDRVAMTLGVGDDYNYDFINLIEAGGSSFANIKADTINLTGVQNFTGQHTFTGLITNNAVTTNNAKVTMNDVLELGAQDPLPAGGVGQLAVSGSNLYFHNGTSWGQIN